jgi:hypothetical protein
MTSLVYCVRAEVLTPELVDGQSIPYSEYSTELADNVKNARAAAKSQPA